MHNSKPIITHIAPHFKLSSSQSPRTNSDFEYMLKVSYSSVVDSLMYVIACSRPDLSYAMSLINRYMENPSKEHWSAVKWIFRYLRGTSSAYLQFGRSRDDLVSYVDSDFVVHLDKRISLIGYVFTIGGCALS
jgi:hypothetical protein